MADENALTPAQLANRAAAAARALAEAEERRRAATPTLLPVELGGRPGPEPTRYGDWERGGVICDF